MAKRFSETNKWKDEKFGDFTRDEKLVFLFLIDNCDNGGFFELNARLNSFLIGISQEDYLKCLEGLRLVLLKSKNGAKYFIKNFLLHQKNLPLNSENNAHKQIISIIKSNLELFDYDFNKLGANQGLFSPIGKGIGNDKGKGKVEVMVKVKVDTEFQETFDKWITYKKGRKEFYKTQESLTECFNHLKKLAKNDPKTALEIVNISMANNWAGLFELKNTQNGKSTNGGNSNKANYATAIITTHSNYGGDL